MKLGVQVLNVSVKYNTAAIATVVTRMVVTENYQRVDAESEDAQGKALSGVEADGQIWYIKLINHTQNKPIKLILISNTLVVTRILGAVILVA